MGTEIERKFLVRGDAWRNGARRVDCAQGYLAAGDNVAVRVRIMGDASQLTVKSNRTGVTRLEFEYTIPSEDARDMLNNCCNTLIEKTRYYIDYSGMTWEVDEFHGDNEGLVVAEIELEREDQPFEKPPWLGDEVSTDSRYFNSNLSKHPYREWRNG
jgi:CYTH domain-containing protein